MRKYPYKLSKAERMHNALHMLCLLLNLDEKKGDLLHVLEKAKDYIERREIEDVEKCIGEAGNKGRSEDGGNSGGSNNPYPDC